VEAAVEPAAESGNGAGAEDLNARLASAEARAIEYQNEALRARADIENLRKRTAREVENAHKYGLERLVNELLPVKESLDLGLAAAATATDVAPVREGLELTVKMFQAALERLGVAEIDPAGRKFNPEQHQAIGTEVSGELEPGTVFAVVQKGYLLRDRLLRPALVRVTVAPAAAAGED
jgi:molecular chaperone GrpE